MNVLCGFDDAYAPHSATMFASLFAVSRKPEDIQIHLISNFLSPGVRSRLDQIAGQWGAKKICWLEVDYSPFVGAPVTLHFTPATYARIAAFDALRVERVLYLDVDLLCLSDVADLHDSNLGANFLGAVLDPGSTFGGGEHNLALGIPHGALCFNGGVLVIDTVRWRKEQMTQKCVAFLQRMRSRILWVDQDVLNGVLIDQWTKLPSEWNAQTHFWKARFRQCLAAKLPTELGIVRAPKIVHFNDPAKPWHLGYRHSHRELYFQYLARSGWPHRIEYASYDGKRDLVVKFDQGLEAEGGVVGERQLWEDRESGSGERDL